MMKALLGVMNVFWVNAMIGYKVAGVVLPGDIKLCARGKVLVAGRDRKGNNDP